MVMVDNIVEDSDEDMIDNTSIFTVDDVVVATKSSNFNKGLGPDCFDGNMLKSSAELNDKIMAEVADALNTKRIPEYLRVGRLVPLQKTSTKGPVSLDEIRPIVVRSHVSKIMEKAILEKINTTCPHVIASKMYQTGFKEGEVHGDPRKQTPQ